MAVYSKELLAPTTIATASSSVHINANNNLTIVMYAASGLTAGEYGDLQISHDDGVTWQDVWQDTAQVRMTNNNNVLTIVGPGTYRIDKELTTNATGIYALY